MQAFDLDPQSAIGGRVSGIGVLRDDTLEVKLASLLMEDRAMAAVIIAVMQGRHDIRQQRGEPRLALDKRPCGDIVAVEMQKIEEEIHQLGRVAGV